MPLLEVFDFNKQPTTINHYYPQRNIRVTSITDINNDHLLIQERAQIIHFGSI